MPFRLHLITSINSWHYICPRVMNLCMQSGSFSNLRIAFKSTEWTDRHQKGAWAWLHSFSLPILLAVITQRSFTALDWENWDFFQYKILYKHMHIYIYARGLLYIYASSDFGPLGSKPRGDKMCLNSSSMFRLTQ